MTRIFAYLTPKWIGIGILVLLTIGYVVTLNGDEEVQTLTLKPGEFVQQVSASGTVTPSQEVDLGFTIAGKVFRVFVEVGDTVRAGTALATIDNGDESAVLQQKLAALAVQEAKLESLKQGTRPEEIAVAESNVRSTEVALAQADQALIDAIKDAYIKSDDAVRNDVYVFVTSPRTASPKLTFTSTDTQVASDLENGIVRMEVELNAWFVETQALTSSSDLGVSASSAQVHLQSISKILSTASVALSRGIPTQSITQTTLNAYAADIAAARASVSAAVTALTSALTAQKAAVADLDAAQKNLALKKAGTVQADINAQAAQVLSAQADVMSARIQLGKTQIVAPFSGVITKVDAKPGTIVSSNSSELSMIGGGAFEIESYVPEVNIAFIKVGDTADITLDAYGDEAFVARVASIDPAETIKDGVPTYRVVLVFGHEDARIKSGMTANVRITTERKENVLSLPQGALTERDGKRYVLVLVDSDVQEREVQTGAVSSLGNVEILLGLSEGDTVILSTE